MIRYQTLALCLCAGLANATPIFSSANSSDIIGGTPAPTPGFSPMALTGDTVNMCVTGFSANGGAYLNGPVTHTVGGTTSGPSVAPGIIAPFEYASTVSTVGSTRTVVVDIYAVGAGAFLTTIAGPGLTLGGAPVTSLRFEMPGLNGGVNMFDDGDKVGLATGTFTLVGTTNGVSAIGLFSTAATITDFGTSFSVSNGVNAGGANLFDPNAVGATITGASFTISYEVVPAPSAAALLGVGALAATRRRRG